MLVEKAQLFDTVIDVKHLIKAKDIGLKQRLLDLLVDSPFSIIFLTVQEFFPSLLEVLIEELSSEVSSVLAGLLSYRYIHRPSLKIIYIILSFSSYSIIMAPFIVRLVLRAA